MESNGLYLKDCTTKIKPISNKDLAKSLGISPYTLHNYNQGDINMPRDRVLKYIEIMRDEVDRIIDWIDEVEDYIKYE